MTVKKQVATSPQSEEDAKEESSGTPGIQSYASKVDELSKRYLPKKKRRKKKKKDSKKKHGIYLNRNTTLYSLLGKTKWSKIPLLKLLNKNDLKKCVM